MSIELVTVPCRTDNYAYLLHDSKSDETVLIDAPEASPLIAALDERGWGLDTIVITHHHGDHVEAVPQLRERYGAQVWGAAADAHRLPPLDARLADGDRISLCRADARVIDVPGHTVGHIAIHIPGEKRLFTADSLMALGCGRLFEGTPEQMWSSLSKLATLDPETLVCSGHEYTAANARFALTIEPQNAALISRAAEVESARVKGEPTVPSLLSDELATNPFLRAGRPEVKAALGMSDAADAEVFATIRRRKDSF